VKIYVGRKGGGGAGAAYSQAFMRTLKAPALSRGSAVSIVYRLLAGLPTKHGQMPSVGGTFISCPKRAEKF
jgi:mono/diheme cytochrome c family protein